MNSSECNAIPYSSINLNKKEREKTMFDDLAAQVMKAEVTTRGNFLKNCAGTAIVTGIREDTDRSGRKAIIDLMVVSVDKTTNPDINSPGDTVQKQYRFDDGTADKKAAVLASFKRDMCTLGQVNPHKVTPEEWNKVTKAATAGALAGLLIRFDPYDTATKQGEKRTYHNFKVLPGANTADKVAARSKKLASGAGYEAFKE